MYTCTYTCVSQLKERARKSARVFKHVNARIQDIKQCGKYFRMQHSKRGTEKEKMKEGLRDREAERGRGRGSDRQGESVCERQRQGK